MRIDSIATLLETVSRAGAMALREQGQMGFSDRSFKADDSVITRVDPMVERYLVDEIESAFPDANILAEEKVQETIKKGLEAVIVNPTVVLGPRDVNLVSGVIVIEAANGNGLAHFYPPGGVNYVAVEEPPLTFSDYCDVNCVKTIIGCVLHKRIDCIGSGLNLPGSEVMRPSFST